MIIDVIDLKLEELNFTTPYKNSAKNRATRIHDYGDIEIKKVEKENDESYNVVANVLDRYIHYNVNLQFKDKKILNYNCKCE